MSIQKRQEKEDGASMSSVVIPHYDNISIYLMSISLIITLAMYNGLYYLYLVVTYLGKDGIMQLLTVILCILLFFLYLFVGIISSIYHAFTSKHQSRTETVGRVYTALFFNLISGVALLIGTIASLNENGYSWITLTGLLLVIMNGISIALLIYHTSSMENTETIVSMISERTSPLAETMMGTFLIIFLIFAAKFILKMNMLSIFSLCINYATLMHVPLMSLLNLNRR